MSRGRAELKRDLNGLNVNADQVMNDIRRYGMSHGGYSSPVREKSKEVGRDGPYGDTIGTLRVQREGNEIVATLNVGSSRKYRWKME